MRAAATAGVFGLTMLAVVALAALLRWLGVL